MSGRRSEYILITDVLALRHGLLRVLTRLRLPALPARSSSRFVPASISTSPLEAAFFVVGCFRLAFLEMASMARTLFNTVRLVDGATAHVLRRARARSRTPCPAVDPSTFS